MTATNRTTADLRDDFVKQHEKWLIGTDDDAEMAQEWVMENLPSLLALLPQPPALGGNDLQNERTAEKLLKNFEDEDWNDKRERLEQNIIDAVSALMIEHMGGASKTVFAPQEGCPYQITIEYGEVKDGSFN